MSDIETFDPALFGSWPPPGRHEVTAGWSAEESRAQAEGLFLETKSAEAPQEALRMLMNDMTQEMRDQFDYFRKLRTAAEAKAGGEVDDAEAKLARADVKAATDAMSLIVRTLEKVDSLQRQLARDRDLEAERNADRPGYEEAKSKLLALIEQKANERAEIIIAERSRAAAELEACTAVGTGPPGERKPEG
ncbi:hypothetical protein [Rhizobium tubonense]|uniref:Uncharacterized protein n=1 Tax=Rhizobium tubonense TaxID=484088 RepID=A0A2W4CWU3_9HYPH|nr:hypothetical protein [Rhizobium tubonense]PZM17097.1 hypothetical protein CPY51_02360 [Rhizobium tubonense]